jgi:hypothetical protein
MSYFDGAVPGGLVQNAVIPFYPAPYEASAGACCSPLPVRSFKYLLIKFVACNLGYVYGNLTATPASPQSSSCVSTDTSTSSLYTCECCEFSWQLSKSVPPLSAIPSPLTTFQYPQHLSLNRSLHHRLPNLHNLNPKNTFSIPR